MNRCIIIVGTGRSGTTWLHDVMTSHFNYRQIFEPLHPRQIPSASRFADLYLEQSKSCESLKKYLDLIFDRRTNDGWLRWIHLGIDRSSPLSRKTFQFFYNLPKLKIWARYRVVKFIHANMMISWLAKNYHHKIAFLLRNPYAVVRSQLNMGWSHNVFLYTRQRQFTEAFLTRDLVKYVESLNTVCERLAAIWCMQNTVAISQSREFPTRVFPVTYEFLQAQPDALYRLLFRLNYSERDVRIIRHTYAIKASLRNSKRKSTKGVDLCNRQKRLIHSVLSQFNMSSYDELLDGFNRF